MSGYFPNGCTCHICDKKIEYRERKRCIGCGKWIHNYCGHGAWVSETKAGGSSYNPGPFGGRSKCYDCFKPFSTMEHVRLTLSRLDEWDENESIYTSGVILVASLNLGPDEQKIAEFTGISLEEVHERGERARESGVWTDEGRVAMDLGDGTDPRAADIGMLVAIMCLEGMIVRAKE